MNLRRPLLFLAVVVVTCAIPLPAFAQQERRDFATGTEVFRRLLYDQAEQKLHVLEEFGQIENPSRTLLIVLGDTSRLDRIGHLSRDWLAWFVERGGAVLIATDRPTSGAVLKTFGVGISGEFVESLPGSASAYRGDMRCPYVMPGPGVEPSLFKDTRLDGQSGPHAWVATNLPSYLIGTEKTTLERPTGGGNALPLAHFPGDCFARGTLPGPRRLYDFAIGGTLGKGKALILADHSIFINSMMLGDNGNLDFAIRCTDWLREKPNGPRDQILFYEDDRVQTTFNIPLKEVPLPLPPNPGEFLWDAARKLNESGTTRKLEEENVLDETAEHFADQAPFWPELTGVEKLAQIVFLGSSVLLGIYGLFRLGMFRHRFAPSPPALATLLAKQPKPLPALQQRQQALLQSGNLWEAARDLTRQFFVTAGVALDAPPALDIHGGWWKRWRMRAQVLRLWRLAIGPRPQPVSKSRFERLVGELRELQAALADGRLLWKGTATNS